MLSSGTNGISVEAIPAFSDNYIWLFRRGGEECAVVDPGEAEPVLARLDRDRLNLRYVLLTHHHFDHIGGAEELLEAYPQAMAFGPDDGRITCDHVPCDEGKTVELADLGLQFSVLEVPAHTRTHIAFHGHGLLFSGDTLFSVGCGKLFEGTAEQMQGSLDKLASLEADTLIYCGHEYTLSNCRFALAVEPDNQALKSKAEWAGRQRDRGQATLPANLGEELAVNPFLRTRERSVVEAARSIDPAAKPGAGVLGVIRRWKDAF